MSGSRPDVQLSTTQRGGGVSLLAPPLWREDGLELYYAGGLQWMAVPITPTGDGSIDVGRGVAAGGIPRCTLRGVRRQRFLVRAVVDQPEPPPVTVIVNWKGEGKP